MPRVGEIHQKHRNKASAYLGNIEITAIISDCIINCFNSEYVELFEESGNLKQIIKLNLYKKGKPAKMRFSFGVQAGNFFLQLVHTK